MDESKDDEFDVPSIVYRKCHDGSLITYKIIKKIGRGGFGVVYSAIENPTGNKVALKCTPKSKLQNTKAKQKLLNEMTIHKSLNHPNIVKFLGVFHDKFFVYCILELCERGDVLQFLKSSSITVERNDSNTENEPPKPVPYLSENETIRIITQILKSLLYLHENAKIIHRDIKLQNFLISTNNIVKLTDFGLSIKMEDIDQNKKASSICGTPNYLSPEVLTRNTHSYAIDVWAIGVSTFIMLTGKQPFKSINKKSTFDKIYHVSYTWPPIPHVSETAKSFVDSVLRRNPNERPTVDVLLMHPFLKKPHHRQSFDTDMAVKKSISLDFYHLVECDENQLNQNSHFSTKVDNEIQHCIPNSISTPQLGSMMSNNNEGEQMVNNYVFQTIPNSVSNPAFNSILAPIQTSESTYQSLQNVNHNVQNESEENEQGDSKDRNEHPENDSKELAAPTIQPKSVNETINKESENTTPICHNNQTEIEHNTDLINNQQNLNTETMNKSDENNQSQNMNRNTQISINTSITVEANSTQFQKSQEQEKVANENSIGLGLGYLPSDNLTQFPQESVLMWWNYSNRYGLGYILSNYSVGVCFNDTSRIIMDPTERFVQYYSHPHGEIELINSFEYNQDDLDSIQALPHRKKVMLVKGFASHLKKKAEPYINAQVIETYKKETDEQLGNRLKNTIMPYVKYWSIDPNDGILFRFNDKSLNVIFTDKTSMYIKASTKEILFDYQQTVTSVHMKDLPKSQNFPLIKSKFLIAKAISKKLE